MSYVVILMSYVVILTPIHTFRDVAKHLKLGGGGVSENFTSNLNFNVKHLPEV
jgi:hypothetical protein